MAHWISNEDDLINLDNVMAIKKTHNDLNGYFYIKFIGCNDHDCYAWSFDTVGSRDWIYENIQEELNITKVCQRELN